MKGRTIRLYLVDGAPTGILTAEIRMSWATSEFKLLTTPATHTPRFTKCPA